MPGTSSTIPIIGMGIISALGNDLEATRERLFSQNPPMPALPTKIETSLALPVFEVAGFPSRGSQPGGYSLQLLMHALDEALRNANLNLERGSKIGVCIGTTVACQLNSIPFYEQLRQGNTPPAEPLMNYLEGNPAEYIRRKFGLTGPALTISNACSSGADAIGIAATWLRTGLCDFAIAGGTDEINKVPLDGFNALGVCSPQPCRPFDSQRQGLNLGEGAGVIILSNRGQSELALAGFGKTADAFHITQPDPAGTGLEKAIRLACEEAGIDCDQLAFCNAHGTGTIANDSVESQVFERVLGAGARFLSTKSLTGHTLGAAGAIEAIITLLMLQEQRLPASVRFETPSPEMPVAPVAKELSLEKSKYALSTSLAFGGSNTALVLAVANGINVPTKPTKVLCAKTIFAGDSALTQEQLAKTRSKYALRRADRFTTLAIAGIDQALTAELPENTALLTVSAFGPHKTVFATLDGILDFPEDQIQPTKFSHSVHNAAASYIATSFGLRGPSYALTGFENPLEDALVLAQSLVATGQAPCALVVQVEEQGALTAVLPQICPQQYPVEPEEVVAVYKY